MNETERGNLALSDGDGGEILWVIEGDKVTFEASFNPYNYPAWNLRAMDKPVSEIVAHVNANLQGWEVRKNNVEGLNLDGEKIAEDDLEAA